MSKAQLQIYANAVKRDIADLGELLMNLWKGTEVTVRENGHMTLQGARKVQYYPQSKRRTLWVADLGLRESGVKLERALLMAQLAPYDEEKLTNLMIGEECEIFPDFSFVLIEQTKDQIVALFLGNRVIGKTCKDLYIKLTQLMLKKLSEDYGLRRVNRWL